MRKLLSSILIAATLISVPAQARSRDDGGYRNHRYERHYDQRHDRHRGGSNWVPALIGGIVLGAVISESTRNDRYDHYDRRDDRYYDRDRRYYEYECIIDHTFDRYGREIERRICR